MVVGLIERNRSPEPVVLPDFNVVDIGTLVSEDYYSITFRGKKIGYSSRIKKALPTGFIYQESSFYRLMVGGTVHEITAQGLLTVDDSLRTKIISFVFSGDNYETTVNASVRGSKLAVTVQSPSGTRTSEYDLSGPIYSATVIPEILVERDFDKANFELSTFDPMTLSEQSYNIQVIGKDRIKRFGSSDVIIVRVNYGPLQGKMYVDTSGVLLMEKTPEGFMSVRENKEVAFKLDIDDVSSDDLLTEFRIPAGGYIRRPRDAVRLELWIANLPSELFKLDDYNQQWHPDSSTLIIDSRGLFPMDSLCCEVLPEDTSETAAIQCHDRRIVALANKITRGKKSNFEKLDAINEYLYENIEKNLTASIPSAIEVLSRMEGDCNEHSILFVALARSLGIPARMNVGLMYMEEYFYYHAWVQAFADSRWQTYDPTLLQSPVDATHIKLTSGGLDRTVVLLRLGDTSFDLIDIEYEEENALTESAE